MILCSRKFSYLNVCNQVYVLHKYLWIFQTFWYIHKKRWYNKLLKMLTSTQFMQLLWQYIHRSMLSKLSTTSIKHQIFVIPEIINSFHVWYTYLLVGSMTELLTWQFLWWLVKPGDACKYINLLVEPIIKVITR